MNRRQLLGLGALSASATLLGNVASGQAPARAERVLRIAHITDAHVQPEHGGGEGLIACLRHLREHAKPDLLLAGGDQVMDVYENDEARAQLLFDLWKRIIADESDGIPIACVMGNHDIWGWNKPRSKTTGNEPRYGKAWALEAFGMPGRYYSFERAGWKVIVLDSVQDDGGSYVAMLDEEQFAWLEAELAKTPQATPILIASHVPIIGFCPLLFGKSDTEPGTFPKPRWTVSRALLHIDARRIKDLFRRHPNVRVALSGHIHLCDRVDYLGVTYLSNPAVSGGWWRGPMQEFENAYSIIDLFSDGSFAREVVQFGWKAR